MFSIVMNSICVGLNALVAVVYIAVGLWSWWFWLIAALIWAVALMFSIKSYRLSKETDKLISDTRERYNFEW